MKDKIKEWLKGRPIQYMNADSSHVWLEDLIHDCIQDLGMAGEWVSVDSITLNEGESMSTQKTRLFLDDITQCWVMRDNNTGAETGNTYNKCVPYFHWGAFSIARKYWRKIGLIS